MSSLPLPITSGTDAFARDLDIVEMIDRQPIGFFQQRILWLLGCAIVMDGFDVQAMGFVAPAIVHEWGVDRATLGPVFGASLIGMLVGSLVLSVVADRWGRRPVLIGTTMFFAICMFATASVHTLTQLLVLRFITGLGLGGVMANAIALAGEYSPRRRRASIMMWVSCGFTGGGLLGGLMSAFLIPWDGWQSVFIFGGAVPMLVGLAMLRFVPESMQFLVTRGCHLDRVATWIRRIAPEVILGSDTRFVVNEIAHQRSPVAELFHAGRSSSTLLLWGINFMNLLNLFFLASWLPTIATQAGYNVRSAVLVGTLLQFGGLIGTIVMGPMIDRAGFYRVLIPCFLIAVVAVAAIGQPGLPMAALLVAVLASGYCVVGAQPALNALAASIYPTAIRATGMGWSLGIGRAGAIVGPVIAGHLIGLQWSSASLFLAAAVPAFLSLSMLVCLSRLRGAQTPSGSTSDAAISH